MAMRSASDSALAGNPYVAVGPLLVSDVDLISDSAGIPLALKILLP